MGKTSITLISDKCNLCGEELVYDYFFLSRTKICYNDECKKGPLKRRQKRFHDFVSKVGKYHVKDLLEFIGLDEAIFDPEHSCGLHSCRHCGCCSGSEYEDNIVWTKVLDDSGKQLEKIDEFDTLVLLFDVECRLCGSKYRDFFRNEI